MVGVGGGGAAAEFVDGEGEGDEGNGEVETALWGEGLVGCSPRIGGGGGWKGGGWKRVGGVVRLGTR